MDECTKSDDGKMKDIWTGLPEDLIIIVLSYLDSRTIFPLNLFIRYTKLHTLSKDEQRKLFQVKCEQGLLSHAKWIKDFYNLTSSDARWDDGKAFTKACKNGHREIVIWLCTTFHLVDFTRGPRIFKEYRSYVNDYDTLSADGHAFSSACKRGHLEIVKFFIDTYSDLVRGLNYNIVELFEHSLYVSMENKHIHVVHFLVDHFALPLKSREFYDISQLESYSKMIIEAVRQAFYHASYNNKYPKIAQYLEQILREFAD